MLTPTYNQIKHWINTRIFANKEELILQLDEIDKLITHLQELATNGHKLKFGSPKPNAECSIYINDISVNSELIYVESCEFTMIYTMYDAPSYLRSQDIQVCTHAQSWLSELVEQSIPISTNNGSQRNIFFQTLKQEYEHQRKKIEVLFNYINE